MSLRLWCMNRQLYQLLCNDYVSLIQVLFAVILDSIHILYDLYSYFMLHITYANLYDCCFMRTF